MPPFDADPRAFLSAFAAWRATARGLLPYRALAESVVEPLPHQVAAVYGRMLARRPVRFLLADDPGTGKTIVAGLLLRELLALDVARCLIVAPGSVVEQWQQELRDRFRLDFALLDADAREPLRRPLLIARLDHLTRDNALRASLGRARWDLTIVDEAHKLATSWNGDEPRRTRRWDVGARLAAASRHLLLISASPHNGREEEFQLLLSLLDGERFAGRLRPGAPPQDPSDLVRRVGKSALARLDGTPLFPPRHARVAAWEPSPPERELLDTVSSYVRDELARAAKLAATERQRRANVELALQILTRRATSSPEAIQRALVERRVQLEEAHRRASLDTNSLQQARYAGRHRMSERDLEELDDRPQDEIDDDEHDLVENATAARTIGELGAEVHRLKELEAAARRLRQSNVDSKRAALERLLDDPRLAGQKVILFADARETVADLAGHLSLRMGDAAVRRLHGGLPTADRRAALSAMQQDPRALLLVTTDAAGEGVNLQAAHIVVHYDLPWNPSRLEQRFGRVHRIGQREPCHAFHLYAAGTGEGELYRQLLDKVSRMAERIGDRAWDVVGQLFDTAPLSQLLLEAATSTGDAAAKARLHRAIEDAASMAHLKELLEQRDQLATALGDAEVAELRRMIGRAGAERGPSDAEVLRRGAVLIDERDARARALFAVECAIRDGAGNVVEERPVFVEADAHGMREVDAPELAPPPADAIARTPEVEEAAVVRFVEEQILPGRIAAAAKGRAPLIDRVQSEVRARVRAELDYLRQTKTGQHVKDRLADLEERLAKREAEFAVERRLVGGEVRVVARLVVARLGTVSRK